jgi:colicin import membrane protein
MGRFKIRRPSGGVKAFGLALLVHAALVGLLVIGFRWQSAPLVPPPPEKIVHAKTMNDPEVDQEIERLKKQEEQRRQQDEEKKRREEATKKKAEEDKKAEAEKKAKAEKKAETDKKAEIEKKIEIEKKRKHEDQQKQADAKKLVEKKKEDEVRRKEAERNLKEQLATEEKSRQQQRRQQEQAQQALSEIAKYEALIRQKVERSWARPPSAQKSLECLVRVRLVQSGEVMSAQVVRSSGNDFFDRSVENAVYKASPLPLPEDKSLFDHFRELEFIFKPEG